MAIEDCPWDQLNPNKVNLANIVCVAYGHPDLPKTHKNLLDFGLFESFRTGIGPDEAIYYRGYGVQPVVYIAKRAPVPVFLGSYFEADTPEDFELAAKVVGAEEIVPFCGGKAVTISDPQGLQLHIVYGYQKREYTPREGNQSLPANIPSATDAADSLSKPRRGVGHSNKSALFQMHQILTKCCTGLKHGITPIHKLGHVGYVVDDLVANVDFYTRNFNFKPSDIMLGPAPEKKPMLLFLHLDRGQKYTDHHTFFPAQAHGAFKGGRPHHSAFETENIDAEFVGHTYLETQGYKAWWGVGRHIEGSQVFDYWYDVDGFIIERYADGDVVNEDYPIGWNDARTPSENVNWGPLRPELVL
ncbi:hypothetical protein IFR05_016412 [Cadophora sp. M221]|nr:hypothetical protein IFR05_016412 [Cadophora sp. M221]